MADDCTDGDLYGQLFLAEVKFDGNNIAGLTVMKNVRKLYNLAGAGFEQICVTASVRYLYMHLVYVYRDLRYEKI